MKCSPSVAHFGEIKVQIATDKMLTSTLLNLYVNFSVHVYDVVSVGKSQKWHFTCFADNWSMMNDHLDDLSVNTTHKFLIQDL